MSERLLKTTVQVDYTRLKGKLGNKNAVPSDIDGVMERKGHVLFIENKFPDVFDIPVAQDILFRTLSKKDRCMVMVTRLEPIQLESGAYDFTPFKWKFYINGVSTPWKYCTIDEVDAFIIKWFKDASL